MEQLRYWGVIFVFEPTANAFANDISKVVGGRKLFHMLPLDLLRNTPDWSVLRQLVARYPLVGLGGHVGLPVRQKERWFSQIFTLCSDGHFHALGLTHDRYLLRYQFSSADSGWWLYKFRDRQRRLSPGDRKAE